MLARVQESTYRAGVMIRVSGAECLSLSPPLVINEDDYSGPIIARAGTRGLLRLKIVGLTCELCLIFTRSDATYYDVSPH